MSIVPAIARTQMFGPATVEGVIGGNGHSTGGRVKAGSDKPLAVSSLAVTTKATPLGQARTTNPANFIRADFAQELQSRLDTVSKIAGLTKLDPNQLDDQAKHELKKLQGAAEGFESHFVKDLLGQMRKSAFSEKDQPTMGMAKDLMDQQLADQTAKSQHGIGIAKMLFGKMGEQVVRQAVGRQRIATDPTGTATKGQ